MIVSNLLLVSGILFVIFLLIITMISRGILREFFKRENYIKSMQFIFVSVLLIIFVFTFIYFWINDVEVDKMDVIFTVVVGWLGLIIGAFFGQKFMDDLTVKELKKTGKSSLNYFKRYKKQINNLLKIIEDYKNVKLKK